MFIAQALVCCDEDIELAGGGGEKSAILQRGPSHLWNSSNLVLWEL